VKEQVGEEFAIEKRDVVLLFCKHGKIFLLGSNSNQNVISERGWSPLTFNCLLDPEIQATKYNSISTNGRDKIHKIHNNHKYCKNHHLHQGKAWLPQRIST
jgi:hypothetical protein